MKKIILLMVCTCVATLSFISCSDSDKDKVPEELTEWFWRLNAYAYKDNDPQYCPMGQLARRKIHAHTPSRRNDGRKMP